MDALKRLEIEMACHAIVNRYALYAGEQDLDAFVGLFTEDGVWTRPGMEMRGRAEMKAFMAQPDLPRPFRHVNGTAVMDAIDEDNAKGVSYTSVYNAPKGYREGIIPMTGPDYIVEYRDRYRRIDGRWYIARRDTTVLFRNVNATALPNVPEIRPANG
jgi:hypothetical protein